MGSFIKMTPIPMRRNVDGRRNHEANPCMHPPPAPSPPPLSCHPYILVQRRRQMVAMATGCAVGRVAVVFWERACCLSPGE